MISVRSRRQRLPAAFARPTSEFPVSHLWAADFTGGAGIANHAAPVHGVLAGAGGASSPGYSWVGSELGKVLRWDTSGGGMNAKPLVVGSGGSGGPRRKGVFTLFMWVNPATVSGSNAFFSGFPGSLQVSIEDTGKVNLVRSNEAVLAESTVLVPAGKWSTVSVSYNRPDYQFVVNGQDAGAGSADSSFASSYQYIGALISYDNNAYGAVQDGGMLRLLAIIDGALSVAEQRAIHADPWRLFAPTRRLVPLSSPSAAALEGAGTAAGAGAGSLSTSIRLVGAAVAGATGAASLSTGINLAGASATVSATGTGALTATIRLAGDAVVAALAAGGLVTGIPLAGAGSGGATGTGALTAGSGLAGAGQAAAQGVGAITTSITLSGAALAAALGTGSLTTSPAGLAGGAVAGGQGAGTLTTAIRLAGAAAASVVGAGGLVTAIPLAGAATAAVSATGDLVVSFSLSGAALVSAISGGALLTSISLSGAAVARAVGTGMLTGAAIHASSWRTRDAGARVRSLRASARVRRALAGAS